MTHLVIKLQVMKPFAIFFFVAISALAHADPIASQEGSTILLTPSKPKTIQIVVNGKNIKFASQIRAILTSNCKKEPSVSVDLVPQTDNSTMEFNGQFSGTLPERKCRPELAVVVDGNWQTDPTNGKNQFPIHHF